MQQHRRRTDGHGDGFLAEAGGVLASALEYDDTLAAVARVAVGRLADLCLIDIRDEDGLRRVQVAHSDPERMRFAQVLLAAPRERSRADPSLRVLASGDALLEPTVTPPLLDALSADAAQRRLLEELRLQSLMAVPLTARGQLTGVLVLASASRSYGEADLSLAERLGRLAALELDNARQYDDAKQALLARDRVLGVVAHDLRNPLNTITMSVELLQHLQLTPEQRRHQLDVIARSAQRMNRLIQDLLDVARMEAGRLLLERDVLQSGTLVRESVELAAPAAAAGGLELSLDVAAATPRILADRHHLLQVLGNLIDNAVKFTPAGGHITVGVEAAGDEVIFSVRDDGPGIAAEDLPHLFEPFWQARRRTFSGAGLGLAIARGIVEAHGGRITVESSPGRGSTFRFTIPRWSGEPVTGTRGAAATPKALHPDGGRAPCRH
jgi:signal transduction histidine kinase